MRLAFRCSAVLALVLLAASCSSDTATLCADRTAATADRTISFGGAGSSSEFTYSPNCMIIASGQTVTFQGDFTMHALGRGSVSDANAGSPNNPIPTPATDAGTSLAVTYPSAGTYPYWCTIHFAEAMNGQVQVQ